MREAFSAVKRDHSLLVFCFLLHVLSKTALLSAPQAVQCEVWVNGGGSMCEKREGTKGGRGGEG